MRIISGVFKSRQIDTVMASTTRPTTDKVRGSIFNIIGPYFDSGIALDLFAGSGSMGLEGLSRGMSFAVFNDIGNEALKVINKNINSLNLKDKTCVTKLDYKKALSFYKNKYKFDYIFLDPPYKMNIVDEIIKIIIDDDLLNDSGLIICEVSKENILDEYEELDMIKNNIYGIRRVVIYERK